MQLPRTERRNLLDVLEERGFVSAVTGPAVRQAFDQGTGVYCGFVSKHSTPAQCSMS